MIICKVTTKPIHGEDPVDMAKRIICGTQVLIRDILKRGGCADDKTAAMINIKWTPAGDLDVMTSSVIVEVTTDFGPWVVSEDSCTAVLHNGLIGLFPELHGKLITVFVPAKVLSA